ncbi:MAG TPA: glycosyltransferase family 2 protein [Anaerolineaceae bacterium]|nr:glycosyltransferase family 2 protein [Anaerolineaceae bacterium]
MLWPIPSVDVDECVCVVIPMYRVAPYIQNVITSLPTWIWRIVAVDDASPDDSAAQVLALNDPRLVLVRNSTNQGVGGAMLTGMNQAVELGATVIVKVDGDGQMPVEYLDRLVQPILQGQADYVKGNRFYHTSEITRMPFVRRLGNISLSFLTKMASGYWNVFDPTNGYISIDAESYKTIDQEHIHRRYFFESSMLMELNLSRAVVCEVTMPARYAGEASSLSIPHVLTEFPPHLIKALFRRLWLQYFVLDFSVGSLFIVAGSLLTLFGLVWGAAWWRQSILTGRTASTGTVMLAVLPFILGFQMLLQSIVFDVQNVPRRVISRLAGRRAAPGAALPLEAASRIN